MGKYDGINVAEVTLIDNGARHSPQKRRILFPVLRYAAAALLILCAFAGKLSGLPFFQTISAFVKSAVTFELPFMQTGEDVGDGAIAAYIEEWRGEEA